MNQYQGVARVAGSRSVAEEAFGTATESDRREGVKRNGRDEQIRVGTGKRSDITVGLGHESDGAGPWMTRQAG